MLARFREEEFAFRLSIARLALSSVVLSSIENWSIATVKWKTDAVLLVAVVCFIGSLTPVN